MQPTLWQQIYDPFGSMTISTLVDAVPVVVMPARAFALSQFLISNHIELKLINVIVSMVALVNLTIDVDQRHDKDHRIGKINHRLPRAMPRTVASSPFTFQCQKRRRLTNFVGIFIVD